MFKSSVCQFHWYVETIHPDLKGQWNRNLGSSSRKLLVSFSFGGTLLNFALHASPFAGVQSCLFPGPVCFFIDSSEWSSSPSPFSSFQQRESGGDKQMVNNEKAKDTSNLRTLKWGLNSAPPGRTSWHAGFGASRSSARRRQRWHVAKSAEAQMPGGPGRVGLTELCIYSSKYCSHLTPRWCLENNLGVRHKFVGCVNFLTVKTKA